MTQLCLNARSLKDQKNRWSPVHFEGVVVDASKVAMIIIDVWNTHWCNSMALRTVALAKQIDITAKAARRLGVRIIHSPSNPSSEVGKRTCTDFYSNLANPGADRRRAFLDAPVSGMRKVNQVPEDSPVAPPPISPPFPQPLNQDLCEDNGSGRVWSRQHSWIEIADPDIVAFEYESKRILEFLAHRQIQHLVFAGVATNLCILHTRRTSLYNMKTEGAKQTPSLRCYLARDLTDTMFARGTEPNAYEVHDSGTAATVGWIERELGVKSVLSSDLMASAAAYQPPVEDTFKVPAGV